MRVAIDVSHLNHEKLSGIGVYTLQLMRALAQLEAVELRPVCRLSRWKHQRYFKMHVGAARPWIPWAAEWGADVVHGPDFRVSGARRAKRIASIMDLAFLREGMTSESFARKKKADLDSLLDDHTPDALIAISEDTRRALAAYRPHLADRIYTTLLGGDHMHRLDSARDEEIHALGKFFLFVGNLEARKNVLGILTAFENFCRENDDAKLVLIGKPGFEGEKILAKVEASPYRERIEVVGYCSLGDLQAYYRHALALVYVSWIEGFGIPVVEAMQLGCPVITSSTTATAEVAGETGWLVNPSDVGAITRSLFEACALYDEPDRRADWVGRASQRASTFTWDRCARETLAVYRKVLEV
ncbi:MAG: glycosyltransferase family 4 protein [Bdellovibrionales bacterium]